ncbi:short transient receptor potential channel 5-like [Bacillus rossius redtenbacheri]|uniref:short transient receptor potential channel 5-like n=1 Tax=Bacillus rossius redtenbacheri TaxID=93214 RepID=UPI002FDCB22F
MAFGRLLLLCNFSYYLGPLQVSFIKMGKDVAKYAVILALIIFSFTAGLGRLYQYYDGMVQVDPSTGDKVQQVSSFVGPLSTARTLFWALFCMSPLESTDVVIENRARGAVNTHGFTQAVGALCFAVFHVICVVLVLNMLVSSTTNTLQKVIDNVNVEWTYSLTEVQLNYLAQSTLPPPLNLIPTVSGYRFVSEWIRYLVAPPGTKRNKWSLMYCCYKDHAHEKCAEKNFPIVMSQLVQRYFREKEQKSEENNHISQLDSLRKELLECKTAVRRLMEENTQTDTVVP